MWVTFAIENNSKTFNINEKTSSLEVFSSLIMGFGQTFVRERRLLEKSFDGRLLKKSSLEKTNIVNCKSNPADILRH